MKDSTWFDNFNQNQLLATIVAYILILIMNLCMLFIFRAVGEQVFPGWSGSYLVVFGVIVSLAAIITNYLVNQKDERFGLLYRTAEFLIIVVGLKLYLLFRDGLLINGGVFTTGSGNMFDIFSGEYLVILILLISIWGLSNVYSAAIRSLQSYQSDLELGEFVQIRSERIEARSLISNLYLSIGLVLITLVTIFRTDLSNYREIIGETVSRAYAVGTAPLIIYFLTGLILLSLSHFAILRGGWLMGKIQIAPKVAANWVKYTAIIFGIVAFIALLLPTDYTSGFLEASYFAIQYLIEIVMFILGILVIPFVLLFGLIGSLLGNSPLQENEPQLPQFQPPAAASQSSGGLPPWLELLKTLLFWIVLSGGMIFFIWYYIRQNQTWLADTEWKDFKVWIGKIIEWFKNLFSRTGHQIEELRRRLAERRKGDIETVAEKSDFRPLSIKEMNAREKILHYYMAFLEENAKYGFAKKPFQTPAQYADQLLNFFPDARESLEIITDGFEAARYSRRKIEQSEANRIAQIRDLLQQRIAQNDQIQ